MMDFVIMTCSFVTAMLLVTFVSIALVLNEKVMKWFTKKYMKMVTKIAEEIANKMEENWE